MNTSILEVLMQRDGLSRKAATEALAEARERLENGDNPEEILMEDFGLEPDYVFDLISG